MQYQYQAIPVTKCGQITVEHFLPSTSSGLALLLGRSANSENERDIKAMS